MGLKASGLSQGTAGCVIRQAKPSLAAAGRVPHPPYRVPCSPFPAPHPPRWRLCSSQDQDTRIAVCRVGRAQRSPGTYSPGGRLSGGCSCRHDARALLWAGCCPQAFTHGGSLGGPRAVCTEGWRARHGLLAVGRPRARPLMGQTPRWAPGFGWGSRPVSPEPLCAGHQVRAHLILMAAQEGGPGRATCPRSQMARGGPSPRRPVPLVLAPRTVLPVDSSEHSCEDESWGPELQPRAGGTEAPGRPGLLPEPRWPRLPGTPRGQR